MCYAVIRIKYNLDKEQPTMRTVETKEALASEMNQLEKIGTVVSVTVYLNHHTHRLVSQWHDELYKEPEPSQIEPPPSLYGKLSAP